MQDQYLIVTVAKPQHSNAAGRKRLRATRDSQGNWVVTGKRFDLYIDKRDVARWKRVAA